MTMLTGLLCLFLAGAQPAKKGDYVYSLKSFEGKKNVLAVFAPSKKDSQFAKQLEVVKAQAANLKKSQTAVFYIFESEKGRADSAFLRVADSEDLRKRYKVSKGAFRVLFIDKKGAVKRESQEPLAADQFSKFVSAK